MNLTDEQVNEIIEDIHMKQTAWQHIEETLEKYNITEKELLIVLWNAIK